MRRERVAASLPAMRSSLLPLPLVAALAIVPASVHAATITADLAGTFTYAAAPGEVNHLSLQGRDDGSVVFYAYGTTVTSAPAGCTVSDSDATCTGVAAVVANLGDGDDSFSTSTPPSLPVTVDGGDGKDWLKGYEGDDVLRGGPGNDKLEGWKGNDTLDGGDGDDELDGAAGADHLAGGAGNDLLHPDDFNEPSADVVDGGPGIDTIDGDYADYDLTVQQPLFFTMAGGADDGRPGENDDIQNVEQLKLGVSPTKYVGTDGNDLVKVAQATNDGSLSGGAGDDDLSGADGMETIDGGAGNDRVVGGFNDDVLTGGPGRDQLIGDLPTGDCGPVWCKYPFGNDTIYAQDGEPDTISCGWGTDTVYADAADVVGGDCETIIRTGATTTPPPPPRHDDARRRQGHQQPGDRVARRARHARQGPEVRPHDPGRRRPRAHEGRARRDPRRQGDRQGLRQGRQGRQGHHQAHVHRQGQADPAPRPVRHAEGQRRRREHDDHVDAEVALSARTVTPLAFALSTVPTSSSTPLAWSSTKRVKTCCA
ncbi:MAG: hypothetical protein JWQ18_965 [Conexibacter sp.]|nr:hypothetical protein [Conexibacter sp.]